MSGRSRDSLWMLFSWWCYTSVLKNWSGKVISRGKSEHVECEAYTLQHPASWGVLWDCQHLSADKFYRTIAFYHCWPDCVHIQFWEGFTREM